MEDRLARTYEAVRPELTAYLCRLVVRPQLAEDLVQTAFIRLLETRHRVPDDVTNARAWLFRVATNLALDELRRHSTWRESMVADLREVAEANPEFVARSADLVGSPETKAVAREHLVACFACTLRNLPERKAAALLLKEVHDFSLTEISDILEASEAQAKNWLQEARAYVRSRYLDTCALIAKKGVCYQCVELDRFFNATRGNPLPASGDHVDARLAILKDLRGQPLGALHRHLLSLVDDLL